MAEAVDRLLDINEVALCGPVIVEIRRGIRSRAERARVLPLLGGCHLLEQPARLWEEAGELGWFLGRRGATVKSLDLLIASYALTHGVPVPTRDGDFELMKRTGVRLLLVEV